MKILKLLALSLGLLIAANPSQASISEAIQQHPNAAVVLAAGGAGYIGYLYGSGKLKDAANRNE